jgi:hypothetical protein
LVHRLDTPEAAIDSSVRLGTGREIDRKHLGRAKGTKLVFVSSAEI